MSIYSARVTFHRACNICTNDSTSIVKQINQTVYISMPTRLYPYNKCAPQVDGYMIYWNRIAILSYLYTNVNKRRKNAIIIRAFL